MRERGLTALGTWRGGGQAFAAVAAVGALVAGAAEVGAEGAGGVEGGGPEEREEERVGGEVEGDGVEREGAEVAAAGGEFAVEEEAGVEGFVVEDDGLGAAVGLAQDLVVEAAQGPAEGGVGADDGGGRFGAGEGAPGRGCVVLRGAGAGGDEGGGFGLSLGQEYGDRDVGLVVLQVVPPEVGDAGAAEGGGAPGAVPAHERAERGARVHGEGDEGGQEPGDGEGGGEAEGEAEEGAAEEWGSHTGESGAKHKVQSTNG